jgi:ABC-type nickel/cobalt efflux system permease component RcnA
MFKPFTWLSALVLILLLLARPAAVAAHPLDEFYQAVYISLAPNRITLQVELYTGVLIAPRILALIDTNSDDSLSEAESLAYLDRYRQEITFEIDDQSAPLRIGSFEFPTPVDLRAGVGIIRFEFYTDLPPDHHGNHHFFYQNNHLSDISVYLVNAIGDAAHWVSLDKKEPDIFQRRLRLEYTIKPKAPLDYGAGDGLTHIEVPGGVSAGQKQLTGYIYDKNMSPLLIIAALSLAIVMGGLHALTPGHGKTLVAAYLIGSRGTVGHAVALGGIVTFTHTASVIVIGLLALLASQFIVPKILVPGLEILSGLLVVGMGLRLLRLRWSSGQTREHDHHHHYHQHDHAHSHEHEHDHGHEHASSEAHHHRLPEKVTMGDLLTLGISGGLVPCPEALGIMLIAIGLNRILFGLGLIVAFSLGLAVVLIVIGILLVRSKSVLERLGGVGGRWQHVLPLASAIIVTILGLGIVIKGLVAYL